MPRTKALKEKTTTPTITALQARVDRDQVAAIQAWRELVHCVVDGQYAPPELSKKVFGETSFKGDWELTLRQDVDDLRAVRRGEAVAKSNTLKMFIDSHGSRAELVSVREDLEQKLRDVKKLLRQMDSLEVTQLQARRAEYLRRSNTRLFDASEETE